MNEFKYGFRRFFKGGSLNIIKVISLGLGFAISFLLLAKVSHELSYDSFIQDSDRVYKILTSSTLGNETKVVDNCSGAIAPGMKEEIPQVEVATRFLSYLENSTLFLNGEKEGVHFNQIIFTDEFFFDIFTTEFIVGNPKEVLTEQGACMISEKLAEKIGYDAIGQQIEFREDLGVFYTIRGVFKDFPQNSSYRADIIIPNISNNEVLEFSKRWHGGHMWTSFLKLHSGTDPDSLADEMYKLQQKYQDIEKYNNAFYYFLVPVRSLHLADKVTYTSVLLVGIIGVIVLLISLFNYLLLRVTSIINGGKNTAIRKSLGADKKDITRGIFADTIIHLFFALIIGITFILIFQKTLSNILDVSLLDILTPTTALIALGLLGLSGLFISLGSGRLVAKQSLISIIREHHQTSRRWKIGLLFIEGLSVSFLLCAVFFTHKQYNHSINIDKGYDVKNVYTIPTGSIDSLGVKKIEDRLRAMPEVEKVSLAYVSPFGNNASANNLVHPETNKEIRNASDYLLCDEHYFELLNIPIIEGVGFDKSPSIATNVLVNETFAHHIMQDLGWDDGVVGKEISITAHASPMTIIGVFKNIRANTHREKMSKDADVFILGGASYRSSGEMLIRLKDLSSASINKVEKVINEYSQFGDIELQSAESIVKELYKDIQNLGHYTIFGSIIAVIIALIGIIGYAEEEVARRRKEIAIRKVNGATFWDILMLFIIRYLKVGIPSTLMGLALAFIAIRKWVQTLQDQITLPILAFFAIGVLVLLITCIIMAIYCYFTANQNPTKYLTEE